MVDFRASGSVVRNSMIVLPAEGSGQDQIHRPSAPVVEAADASRPLMEHSSEPTSVRSKSSLQVTSLDRGEASSRTTDVQINKETIQHDGRICMGDNCRVTVSHEASPLSAVPLIENNQVIDATAAAGREEESNSGVESTQDINGPREQNYLFPVQERERDTQLKSTGTAGNEVSYPESGEEAPSLFKTIEHQPSKLRNSGLLLDNSIEPPISDGKAMQDHNSVAELGPKEYRNQEAPIAVDTEKQTETADTEPEGSTSMVTGTGYSLDPGGDDHTINFSQEGESEPPISGGDKLGDQGLGFYLNGYIDSQTKDKRIPVRRPWNAGPGEGAIRRGPLGPARKPSKKAKTLHEHSEEEIADESDGTRAFMARMVAQRNSRAFQTSLMGRQQALDKHILALLTNMADPTFLKKKHGYNVHGQMVGKDGKMISKLKTVKTEAEKAKLSWYRKIYEDRLGDRLPSKELGDSIEARREAYAYSRHFTAHLNDREDELHRGLTEALKGQTKLDFITEDFHYPGAYDTDGRLIYEKGVKRSNKLIQSDKQRERAFSYRFQATERYRAAHQDIVSAIANTDEALHVMFRKSDPIILQEIAEEAVESTGMGIHRQRNTCRGEHGPERKTSPVSVTTKSPSQLREKFAVLLETQIKSKDKALMKEVAIMEDKEVKQIVNEFGQGVEVLPSSWRQDRANLKYMQRRRKQLIAQLEAERNRVVSPWRPGGLHIAHEPWKPLTLKDHRSAIRSASEMNSDLITSKKTEDGGRGIIGKSDDKPGKGACRPRTAPTHRGHDFMGLMNARARRIVAAQTPGTPLLAAFSTYSNSPFKLKPGSRPKPNVGSAYDSRSQSNTGTQAFESVIDERKHRAWVELSGSSKNDGGLTGSEGIGITRPHVSVVDNFSRGHTTSRRPSTAPRALTPSCANEVGDTAVPGHNGNGAKCRLGLSSRDEREHEQKHGERSTTFDLQSGPGVTVLSARLCGTSSDVAYKSSTWPSAPRAPSASRPIQRRVRPSAKFVTDKDGPPKVGCTKWAALKEKQTLGARSGNNSRQDVVTILPGNSKDLEDLEKSLLATSWRRINQRKRVFSGYRIRSRRARIWDPGSTLFAEDADRRPSSTARSSAMRRTVACAPQISSQGAVDGVASRLREDPLDADPPVDMDWKQVDTELFSRAAHEMREALEGRLITVVTRDRSSSRELDECFRRAQDLEESAKRLFGYPQDKRERFEHECEGAFRIGKYVAAVSRLNRLRTASCGVVEIVGLVRRREELLQALSSQDDQLSSNTGANGSEEAHEGVVQRSVTHTSASPSSVCSLERQIRRCQERQALANFSNAILDSLKLWLSILPRRIRVLYDGQHIVSKLEDEEQMVPWPEYPDCKSVPTPGQKQAERNIIN